MNRECDTAAVRSDAHSSAHRPNRPPGYEAVELVGSEGKAEIALDGQVYTLRITKQRKLLLTK